MEPVKRSLLASALAVGTLALAVACAHAPAGKPVSPGGRLVVRNTLDEEVELFVDGNRVDVLPPGRTDPLDRLRLGDVSLEAVGRLTGVHIQAKFHLDADYPKSWDIKPSPEEADAIKALPTGSVKAVNRAAEPVRIFIDGSPREMVWPAGEAEYSGLRLGTHKLHGEGVRTGFGIDANVSVSKDVAPVFVVQPPRGALRVTNKSGIQARVVVERLTGRVLPTGEAFSVPGLAAGTYRVSAADRVGRQMWTASLDVKAGEMVEADIPGPKGVLAVISDIPMQVTVVADGRNLGTCAARGAAEFGGLVPGPSRLRALGPDGTVLARTRLKVPETGQATWMVKPGTGREASGDEGSVNVVNQTGERVRLRVDGWDRGEILDKGRRVVSAMVPGEHGVEAYGLQSKRVFQAEVDVDPGAQVSWTILPSLATLTVHDARAEDIRVLLDGSELAVVAAGESTALKVASGPHRLEARGVTTLAATEHKIVLAPGAETRMELGSPLATLVVTNRQGEPLKIGYGDRDLGVVLPGDRVTIPDVTPGTLKLTATAIDRPLSWTQPVTLEAGDVYKWDLKK